MPIIAAINGPAVRGERTSKNNCVQVGAGLCLALGGADIRVASAGAKMGVTFTKLGLHPGVSREGCLVTVTQEWLPLISYLTLWDPRSVMQ